jgi:chromosome segregation ATPase
MSIEHAEVTEARQQVERWLEDSQYVLGRLIPGVLEENRRLRDRAQAAEQDCERTRGETACLRQENGELQAELKALRGQHDHLRDQQAALADVVGRAAHHLSQLVSPINELVARVQTGAPVNMDSAVR